MTCCTVELASAVADVEDMAAVSPRCRFVKQSGQAKHGLCIHAEVLWRGRCKSPHQNLTPHQRTNPATARMLCQELNLRLYTCADVLS